MTQVKLSAIAQACMQASTLIVTAAAADVAAADCWLKVAKRLHKDNVPSAALVKGSEKTPNPQFDEQAYEAVKDACIAGLGAKRKPEVFPYPIPGAKDHPGTRHKWTVGDMLATDAKWLRDNDASETFRAVRKTYMVKVDQLIGRVLFYLRREENPDGATRTKGKDKGENVATFTLPETREQMIACLNQINAKATSIPGIAAKSATDLQDAMTTGIAILRSIKAPDAKK